MGREPSIDPHDIDKLADDDDAGHAVDYRDDHPHQVMPDRPQPRYRRQTTAALGQSRRHNDPFSGCRDEPETYGDQPKRFDLWKKLTAIAKDHAIRLRNYREDRIADLIEREIVPQVRKALRGVVRPEEIEALIHQFTELVWDEIEK